MEVTKDGEPFLTVGATTWHNLNEQGVALLTTLAAQAEKAILSHANKGGPLTVASEVMVTGGQRDTIRCGGITYQGLVDIEQALLHAGDALLKAGQAHAAEKHGK
jgi:hypothetical protein